MTDVTPTDRPKSVHNSCVIKVFDGVFMFSRCFLDCSVGVGVYVTGLSQISSFFSLCSLCVLLIKRLLRLVGRWARKPVNHTSWVAFVTPTDRPKSVRNRCLIELFCGVVCVVTLPF